MESEMIELDDLLALKQENEALYAEVKRLRAELAEREWRPIESAPRDGSRPIRVLLGFDPDDVGQSQSGVCVGYWDAYYAPGGGGYCEGGSAWVEETTGERVDLIYGHPTHWMPIPEPPSGNSDD